MTDRETTEVQAERGGEHLYRRHIEGFLNIAEKDLDKALRLYGFTVWHSLPPKERTDIKERLGILELEASDYYNRATALLKEGKYAEAEADFRKALEKDPDFAPAAFNLAVALEKSGNLDEAREAYENYLEILDRAADRPDLRLGNEEQVEAEKARVRQHLESLGES